MDESVKPETRDKDYSAFQSPHEASVDRLVKSVDRAYHHPWLMMWRAFWQGVATAIGLSVGYALVVFLVVFLFNNAGGIELFRPGLQKVQNMIVPKVLQDQLNNTTPTPQLTK